MMARFDTRRLAAAVLAAVASVSAACARDPASDSRTSDAHPVSAADAPASESNSTGSVETAEVAGTQLRLASASCSIDVRPAAAGASVALKPALSLPCHFVVDTNGKPQVVATPQGGVLLVASFDRRPDSRFCDTRVRAIIVTAADATLSVGEQKIRSCDRGPFDTKMFFVLAAPNSPTPH